MSGRHGTRRPARRPTFPLVAPVVRVGVLVAVLALVVDVARAAAIEPGITLRSDDATVHVGDSITVEVEAIGLIEPLDVGPMSRHADLLRETKGTRIGVVGGQVVEVRTRRMEFLPRAEGTVFFGPLVGESAAGTVRSNALSVAVLPPPDIDWRPGADALDLAFELVPERAVVGERLVAELVLRHRHAIADETILLPAFDDFDVLPLVERRRTVATDESGPWREITWRWLLFPRRSGTIALGSVLWRGEMIRSRTQRGRFERRLQPPALAVQPMAVEPGEWWLPARAVRLSDAWSKDVRELRAGDEIVRTITLSAEGVLASHLPVIEPFESRSITSTPIGVEREQSVTAERVSASATFAFRLRATSPVPVFLDTVRVPWWDTDTRAPREAIVPARRINVALPERADLLADLALADDTLARARLWLASLDRYETALRIAFVLLSIALAALLAAEIRGVRGRDGARVLPPL